MLLQTVILQAVLLRYRHSHAEADRETIHADFNCRDTRILQGRTIGLPRHLADSLGKEAVRVPAKHLPERVNPAMKLTSPPLVIAGGKEPDHLTGRNSARHARGAQRDACIHDSPPQEITGPGTRSTGDMHHLFVPDAPRLIYHLLRDLCSFL